MSNDPSDRLSELLSSARDELETDAALEDVLDVPLEELGEQDELTESDDLSPLLENAADAREIIETNDPEAVLEAVGLAELPDGSEPASIPEAIAKAPEDELRELHALVTLATVADLLEEGGDGSASEGGEDDWRATLEDNLYDLQETLQADGSESQQDTESESGSEDASDTEDGSDGEGDLDGESSGEVDSSDETDSEDESMLESVAGTGVESFGDELESLQDRLEGLRDGDTDDSTDEGDGDREADDGESEREESDQQEDEDGDDEDGVLGGGEDGGVVGGDEDSSSGRSTRHSTMPSSDRPDMNAVARPSTMPDRN